MNYRTMDSLNKVACFEYFLFRIIQWYRKCNSGHMPFITRLKALKLLFLASAIKIGGQNDLLDIFDRFFAMQHGPVEGDIYNAIVGGQLTHYKFEDVNLSVINEANIANEVSEDFQKRIDNSISSLFDKNPKLIQMPSFQLVEITHKWSCWQQSMEVAKILGKGSYLMDVEGIRNSNQIFE